jgi:lipopolysaccharide/colanic/teichoic acid biosynthesis glycosyltransferase
MIKRTIDIIGAALCLLVLTPVIGVVALLINRQLGSPIFFSQIRPGLDGQPFRMFKFRTMTDARDENGELLPDVQRLPPFGVWLRATSMDELPELWNVIRGDMSLVGPRPLLMEYLPLYSLEQARRHGCRPGITGWAQVNGRNTLDWNEKFALDVWYVNNQSLLLDVRILYLTLIKVFTREGVNGVGEATMSRFEGNS